MSVFQKVSFQKPKRSMFDLSHERKFSMNMGDLVPIFNETVMPGDKFRINSEILMRLAPMVAPIMHRVNVYTHWFFIPYRLIWSDFEEFITGGKDGLSAPVVPFISKLTGAGITHGSLADYLGVATRADATSLPYLQKFCTLPFRAYTHVYNEYFRNQNVQDEVPFSLASGSDETYFNNISALRKRNWERDYFTSALPDTQRGPEVSLDFGSTINYMDSAELQKTSGGVATDGNLTSGSGILKDSAAQALKLLNVESINFESTVNDLRRAVRMQEFFEVLMRGGSRYKEMIQSIFGVRSRDSRLDRAEYLGGGRSPVTISEVLQTSESGSTPQGGMAGHGVSVGSHGFKDKYFDEFGIVMGIMSVMPKTAYMQGTRRQFRFNDRFDFPFPQFAQIGEQPVYNYELYNNYDVADADLESNVFGYVPRYSEFKFIPSSCHGDFKTTQDFWHMTRKFTSQPGLNSTFVTGNPTHRVFAVTTETVHKLYVQMYNNVKAVRPLPYYGTPTL